MSRKFFIGCLLFLGVVYAAPSFIRVDGGLDIPQAKQAYKDGDFDKVRLGLEAYLRQSKTASREDRIFAYKYLGVVYATQEGGKAHAETYFEQLFDLSPNVEVAEMYVSKSVEDLFHQVKADHQQRASYRQQYDEFGNPINSQAAKKESTPPPTAYNRTNSAAAKSDTKAPQPIRHEQKIEEKHALWPWILAGGAVAIGVTVYIVTQKGSSGNTTVVTAGN